MQDKYEAAETFFEAATCVDAKSVIAWTMLGKSYFEKVSHLSSSVFWVN